MILSTSLVLIVLSSVFCSKGEEEGPVVPPSNCEVCKILATELKDRLDETGRSKEVLEMGHGLDPRNKKRKKYNTSELRLIEALTEPHICDKILEYKVHKERKGSLRFAKGQSETFETLENLVHKGVKVIMDVPYELWNHTSAEVSQMHKRCFNLVEKFEDEIEHWYYSNQDRNIIDFLCRDTVLKNDDQSCLDEVYEPKGEDDVEEAKKPSKSDKDKKKHKKGKSKQKGDAGKNETPKKAKKTEL